MLEFELESVEGALLGNDELGLGEAGVGIGGDGTRPLGGETLVGCGVNGDDGGDEDSRR